MNKIAALIIGLLISASAILAVENPPSSINYQGKLQNAAGQSVANGVYTVQFRLYNLPAAGNILWGKTYSVQVADGYFNTLLGEEGSANPETGLFPDVGKALGNTSNPYLGLTVTVDPAGPTGASEIIPRMRLLSSPYALIAQTAKFSDRAVTAGNSDLLQGQPASAFVQLDKTTSQTIRSSVDVQHLTARNFGFDEGTVFGNLTVQGTMYAANTVNGGFTPIGGIIMWAGRPHMLPSGWRLCNGVGQVNVPGGSLSIPDLRSKFILGSGDINDGALHPVANTQGGSLTIAITSTNLPQHKHIYRDTTFSETGFGNADWPDPATGLGDWEEIRNHDQIGATSGYDRDNTLHGIYRKTENSGGQASPEPIPIMPPYYALAFIIRVE
ncbi:MAG: hypothetical protein EXS23_00285 [Pedosphaera sp.]|nr:hypothetical protein [Pedosphaera sp.]